eukprot:GFUD01024036.1.p1 GENE.GFUD01024036.1~~GFUD01024036.1.p1  ORF type:complete len:1014 (-),score=209.34 GFUD01024036.1:54-3095(-)
MDWPQLIKFWILLLIPAVSSEYRQISISLVPRSFEEPRNSDNFICGKDTNIDTERHLAEQNQGYIFDVLDNTQDESDSHKTEVFDVISFTQSGSPQQMISGEHFKNKFGLFSLFLLPAMRQCNAQTFENSISEASGYYPVFIGISNVFQETDILDRFKADVSTLQSHFLPKEDKPKLCGSYTPMLPINNIVAISRKESLVKVFNFLYNEERDANSFNPSSSTNCRTIEETEDSLYANFGSKLNYFDKKEYKVEETEGFLEVTLNRDEQGNKAVAFIETIDQTADETDFVKFKGPVVFLDNSNTTSFFIRLKRDEDVDDETFALKVKSVQNRKKRGLGDKTDLTTKDKTTIVTLITGFMDNFFSFCKSCPKRSQTLLYNSQSDCSTENELPDSSKNKKSKIEIKKDLEKKKLEEKKLEKEKRKAKQKKQETDNSILLDKKEKLNRIKDTLHFIKDGKHDIDQMNFGEKILTNKLQKRVCSLQQVCNELSISEEGINEMSILDIENMVEEDIDMCKIKVMKVKSFFNVIKGITRLELKYWHTNFFDLIDQSERDLQVCKMHKKYVKDAETKRQLSNYVTEAESMVAVCTNKMELFENQIKLHDEQTIFLTKDIASMIINIDTNMNIDDLSSKIDNRIKELQESIQETKRITDENSTDLNRSQEKINDLSQQSTTLRDNFSKERKEQKKLLAMVHLDHRQNVGPFRKRNADGQLIMDNNGDVQLENIPSGEITDYVAWFSKKLHIPLSATIFINTNINQNAKNLPRPQDQNQEPQNRINQFTTDLRTVVRPTNWNDYENDAYKNLDAGTYEDYTNTWKYMNINHLERGHLIAAKIFLQLFKMQNEVENRNIVFDLATYMTNVFPQFRRDNLKSGNKFPSQWNTAEDDEMKAAISCVGTQTVSGIEKTFIMVHGTVPSKEHEINGINIPKLIFMVYCCSDKTVAKFKIFEQVFKPNTNDKFKNDKLIFDRDIQDFQVFKEGFDKLDEVWTDYDPNMANNFILSDLKTNMKKAACFIN